MAEYVATVRWSRGDARFIDNRYSRIHEWEFDGGATISASASPLVVPTPLSSAAAVDPEEAFVVSLSSCHMLWFLSIAAGQGFVVDSYEDKAVGRMAKNEAGKLVFDRVTLRPDIRFSGPVVPDVETIAGMHRRAHEECFIANSVRTAVVIE